MTPIDTYSPMYRQALALALILRLLDLEDWLTPDLDRPVGGGEGGAAWNDINIHPSLGTKKQRGFFNS